MKKFENRGSKKYCDKCKRKIDRLEDYFRLKRVKALTMDEIIIKRYCLDCGGKLK